MNFENKHIRNLQPYKVASHKIWDVPSEQRLGILKLDWNEATIPPSPLVAENISKLLNEPSFFQYYPSTYSEELHQKLSDYVNLPKENIQYFPSSDSLHEYISTVFLNEDNVILILGPTYDNFRLTAESHGCKIHYFNYKNDFTLDIEAFDEQIGQLKPSMVYICNPNNPTGNLIEKNLIQKLIEKFQDVLFLIDEAYIEFCGNSASNLVLNNNNILITRTFSKAFALANFRIGYLISSSININAISKVRNAKNFTTFSQVAAISALSDLQYTFDYVQEVNRAKLFFIDYLTENFKIIEATMGYGNFILLKFPTVELKIELFDFLQSHNIFLRNLTHSDMLMNCLRITIGTKDQMKLVLNNISDFFENR